MQALKIEPVAYEVTGCDDEMIRIEACGQSQWIVVTASGFCLSIDGEWREDPGCRFRSHHWYINHLHKSLDAAIAAIERYQKLLNNVE